MIGNMRKGWNPTRRNRNIGTARSGHGSDNRFVIPSNRALGNVFWGNLTDYHTVTRLVNGKTFSILVEATREGSIHSCTVDDLFHLLGAIPLADLEGLDFLVLRQPKRKEEVLASCWGRLVYHVEIDRFRGPAVILESGRPERRRLWPKSLRPADQLELERLRQDGHRITTSRRRHVIESTLEATRATQLYRTLPHEIGHWSDYLRCVRRPAATRPFSFLSLWDRYHQKPATERETFAHHYAARLRRKWLAAALIPFPRILKAKSLQRDGLRIEDFVIA
jgi:hypothetical protein